MDYDGTLADFEPTPDIIKPDPTLSELLTALALHPGIRLGVVSGRRLADLCTLLPVRGIWLAGTYGAECLTPQGVFVRRLDKDKIRPILEMIKIEWQKIIAGDPNFHLEDKGVALALHARYAEKRYAEMKLAVARQIIEKLYRPDLMHILDGNKFLEVAPAVANKAAAVKYILEADPWLEAALVYLGDDDKDEVAFQFIRNLGGTSILISQRPVQHTEAHCRLLSPSHAREWLKGLSRCTLSA